MDLNALSSSQAWVCFVILCVLIVLTPVFHDRTIANAKSLQKFHGSFLHKLFRWTGPVPTLLIVGFYCHLSLLISTVCCQIILLSLHFFIKFILKKHKINIRPSGHARVALNTIIYLAYFEYRTTIQLSFFQLTLVYIHSAILFVMAFISGIAYHPFHESIAGMSLSIVQIIFFLIFDHLILR